MIEMSQTELPTTAMVQQQIDGMIGQLQHAAAADAAAGAQMAASPQAQQQACSRTRKPRSRCKAAGPGDAAAAGMQHDQEAAASSRPSSRC